jgi:hypothetical protein
MMNPSLLEKRISEMTAAMEKKQKDIAKQLSDRAEYPEVGDIFILDDPANINLQWVVLESHQKDEQFLLTVAADTNPMVGSSDIGISDKVLCGPLTLRCHQAIWINKNDLNQMKNLRIGVLENWHRQRGIDKVQQIANKQLRSTILQQNIDKEPAYEDWIIQVNQEQFKKIENEAENDLPIACFSFVARLEPRRQLELEIDWEEGKALLLQSYEGEPEPPIETFQSLYIGEHRFEFEKSDADWECELSANEVSEIAKVLNLAEPYQNWAASLATIEPIQKSLLANTAIILNSTQKKSCAFSQKWQSKRMSLYICC